MRVGAKRAGVGRGSERIQAGVLAQSMEGDGMDSLWRAMNVMEGGQGTRDDAKEGRDKVVATVKERWKAGELQEPLPPGNGVAGVHTEDGTRDKDGGGAGG